MAKKPFKNKVNTAPKKPTKQRPSFMTAATTAERDARARLKAGIEQRASSNILISPDEVSGDYDASRALLTTLGGQLRPITYDDLKAFRATVRALGNKFKGGITAKQVIDLSMPGPRERANKEIKFATPFNMKGGRLQFQTNAGPESKHKFHVVTVEFLNYEACVASPVHADKIVGQLLKGKIKLDCSCEHWRYVLRYLATTGRYAAGPWFEQSYPKLTNPMLLGVGCKHVLRVMKTIDSIHAFKGFAVKMIETGRKSVEQKLARIRLKEMEEFDKAARKEDSRRRSIKTTEEKRAARAAQPSAKRREQDLKNKAQARGEERARQKAAKNAEKAYKEAKAQADNLLSKGFIDQTVYEQILAKAKQGV